MSQPTPETADLKESFKRSGIWRMGFSFADVMHNDLLRRTLILATQARLKRQMQNQTRTTTKPALF